MFSTDDSDEESIEQKGKQKFPLTFLMLGAQRCGTTWTDEALREHPDVFLPEDRKTAFFDENYEQGIDWYLSHFKQAKPEYRAIGEVASGYCLPHAIPRVAEVLPDVKLIMSMRDPIERAYSYYISRHKPNKVGWNSFEEALEHDPRIMTRGRYIEQVEAILDHYDRSQLLLLFYDDLAANEKAFLRSILKFIGVNQDISPSQIGQRRHSGQVAKIRHRLEKLGLQPVIRAMKHNSAGNFLRRIVHRSTRNSTYRSQISKSTRQRLLDYYKPLNDRLAEFTNRDLSRWNSW